MGANSSYKQQIPLEDRRADVALAKKRYPRMIPVILENAENSQYPDMARKIYLVPKYGIVGDFADLISSDLKLNHGEPIYLSTTNNGMVLENNALMSTVYDLNKDEDGALYIKYSGRVFIRPTN